MTKSIGINAAYRLIDELYSSSKGRPKFDDHGQRHHNAKLTNDDVYAILDSTQSDSELAKIYGVLPSTVASIRMRRSWKHLSSEHDGMIE